MVFWYFGILVLWYFGTLVLWYFGNMGTLSFGTLAPLVVKLFKIIFSQCFYYVTTIKNYGKTSSVPSYQRSHTTSHPNRAVKNVRATLVLGWETTRETVVRHKYLFEISWRSPWQSLQRDKSKICEILMDQIDGPIS